jgi:hypothetical protein
MRYNVTGGIEHGIHYTRFIEENEEEQQDQSMRPKEGTAKSVDIDRDFHREIKDDNSSPGK